MESDDEGAEEEGGGDDVKIPGLAPQWWRDLEWVVPFVLIAMMIVVVGVVLVRAENRADECAARGGVYLRREWLCIDPKGLK